MAATPKLPGSTEVVIIGGGIMGTSTAFFLSEESNLDITLIEKDNIGSGSTGDSSAILRHHYGPQEIYTKMAWWSHKFYRSFDEETGEPIAHEDNPLIRVAKEDTPSAEYALAGYDVLSSLDIPVSRFDQEEVNERYDMYNFGEFDFAVSDDTAGYSDGADAANGFARAAQKNGATMITGVSVDDFKIEGTSISSVSTIQGEIDCDSVVLTAGPWTGQLASRLGVDVPLLIEREQVVILDPPEEYKDKYPNLTPTTALPGGEWYIRPDFGDGILVATHHTRQEVDPDRYEGQPDEETLLELTDKIEEVIPEAANSGIQGQYCGVYSTTPDHDFIIDRVGVDNCFIACGFSGHGFKHGPAIGRILSDLIIEGQTDFIDIDFFSLDRFDEDPDGHGLPDDYA